MNKEGNEWESFRWKWKGKSLVKDLKSFFVNLCMAILIGFLIGGYCSIFGIFVREVTRIHEKNPRLLFFLPLGGLFIIAVYYAAGIKKSRGTNRILESIFTGEIIPLKATPLITVGTLITHLFGGSAGREGAALQIGGSMGNYLGLGFKMEKKDVTILTMCGMSAAFSALFGTPLAACVFSMEVISIGIMHYSAIVPCAVSALLGANISLLMGLEPEYFPVKEIPRLTAGHGGGILLLAIICALVSYIFCVLLHLSEKGYQKFFKNAFLRAFVGGLLVIAFSLLFQTRAYNGSGIELIKDMVAGEGLPFWGFLAKMFLTALTLGAGYKGGEIIPTVFVGAALGTVFGPMLGFSVSLGAALGICGLFCGVTNCPLTAILLSFELFGFEGMPYYLLIAAISYRLSGYTSLYKGQKIIYSKSKPEYINRHPH